MVSTQHERTHNIYEKVRQVMSCFQKCDDVCVCMCTGSQVMISRSGGQLRVENVVHWPMIVQQFLAQRRQRDRSSPDESSA